MNVTAAISKEVISFMGFVFVDNTDLMTDADDVHTTVIAMIAHFQAMMICWNGGIRASDGLIAPEKTRWFLISFYWDRLDWAYYTKDTLPGDITFLDKNGVLYTVTRDEPSSTHTSLGLTLPLNGCQAVQRDVTTGVSHLFVSQMGAAQCDKTFCLNVFNTSFIPSLSYTMIATQFTEQQWNKMISPAIQATLNAADVVRNLAHTVLYGPEEYQGLAVKNPYFLQEIVDIIAS